MPDETTLSLLTGDGVSSVDATVDGERVRVTAAALEAATGWILKPEGLCRADACIPVRDPDAVDAGGRIDLAVAAAALRRPLVVELAAGEEPVAVLGDAAADRAAALQGLEAPTFELPGVDGGRVALEDFAGTKRLLLAWASW